MSNYGKKSSFIKFTFLLACIFFTAQAIFVSAQTTENIDGLRQQADSLLQQKKYIEALPVLEKLAKAEPDNANTHFYLGFSLLSKAFDTKDAAARQQLRVRARNAFVKARELGKDEPLVQGLIDSIPPDGKEGRGFSDNAEANELMKQGEVAFSSGKMDEALSNYQKALQLDPKIYEAALFAGDVYKEKGDYEKAETWYQKAITIDPKRETAYRYSATPLMMQKKYDQARDRYVEAFISEPYSQLALSGLVQWGQVTGTRLAHPRFDIPEFKVGKDGKAESNITLGSSLEDDGSIAWIGYSATRSEWLEKKFAKTFPNEKTYRHTLQEEAEALRSVITTAKELKSKKLNPQLAALMKLNEEGLLEAYILMAIPDQGIAQDHAAYLAKNRDKLRQYMVKYVIGGK